MIEGFFLVLRSLPQRRHIGCHWCDCENYIYTYVIIYTYNNLLKFLPSLTFTCTLT